MCERYVSYLVKELFACRVGLDGKLQLSVHGGDAHIDLKKRKKTRTTK